MSEQFDPDDWEPCMAYVPDPDGGVTVVDVWIVPVPAVEAPPPDGVDPG